MLAADPAASTRAGGSIVFGDRFGLPGGPGEDPLGHQRALSGPSCPVHDRTSGVNARIVRSRPAGEIGEVAEQIVGVKSKRDLKASLDKVTG